MSDEFKVLTPREHVILRPNMYVGSVAYEPHERFLFGKFQSVSYVPGLVKIIDEIIDNSVDEGIRTDFKFANKIDIRFDLLEGSVTVVDNGRGIPQSMVETPDGEMPKPVAAWTQTMAGSNFDDTNRVSMGMNGVGSSLTNFFSKKFIGETCDGKNFLTVTCSEGASNIDWKTKPGKIKGTSVYFIPDEKHFEGRTIDQQIIDIISDRITALSVVFPQIKFTINGQIASMKFADYAKMFGDESLIVESDKFSIAICNSPEGFRQVSYVNGLNIKNGGSHIDYLVDGISEELMPAIKKKHKIEISKARVKECLTMVVVVRGMSNLRFDSQTKERLTNPAGEVKSHFDLDFKKLSKQIMNTDAILQPIIEAALARHLAAEKAAMTKAQKAAAKTNCAKHIKAGEWGRNDIETTLFLTEGESAIGYLLKVKDENLHGGYALRGKVMNTWGMKGSDVLKNNELSDICAITGLDLANPDDISQRKYKNIAIMTDADPDGQGSIYPCLLAFFARWPKLFDEGSVRFVKTPVVILNKGKNTKWFYTLTEFEKEKKDYKGWDLRYIKGLGSLREHEYSEVVNNPNYDIVDLGDDWEELFEMLLGDDAALRKEWMSQ
ncbi:DNA topoisomerase large subunit [Aeromonas phage avDM5]|uniref:DNA topoisomerase (ATP-hydrolyzing) n=1 Tax=Aeromonas phage vB_AehM_DM2 TaxID=2973716 RepID=A0AA95C4B1_9CAUD|nr:DNA topoisomerase large subunit [Aeromonas phage avDM5]UYD60458.1 DNA topoisomerase large subunit [Aeromonas phage avDM2]UYD60706.1 DNA topoisomerase large subunit [Aeromonas phage avDM2]